MSQPPAARPLARFSNFVLDRRNRRVLQTSCPISEELFSLLEFQSEIEESGLRFLQNRSGCCASDAAIVYPKFQAFIRQAKTFFIPAETLHHRARPLFYYYAFLNLAKSLLCTQQPALFLSSDRFRHGLSEHHRGGDFQDETVGVNQDGVFCELYNAVVGKRVMPGTEFKIVDMLRFISDIAFDPETGGSSVVFAMGKSRKIYDKDEKTFWPLLAVYGFKKLANNHAPVLTDFMNYFEEVSVDWRSRERIFDIMGSGSPNWAYFQGKRVYSNDSQGLEQFKTDIAPLCTEYFTPTVHSGEMEFHLAPPIGPNYEYPWNEFLAGYVCYFYLGSLVRYHPSYLESLLRTRVAWTLESFTKSSAETLLRHVASLILGEIVVLNRR